MTAALAMPGNTAATFLTYFFGSGLVEDTYVVEKFIALVNGDIRRCPDAASTKGKGRRKTKYATASLKAVKEMRPVSHPRWIRPGLHWAGCHACKCPERSPKNVGSGLREESGPEVPGPAAVSSVSPVSSRSHACSAKESPSWAGSRGALALFGLGGCFRRWRPFGLRGARSGPCEGPASAIDFVLPLFPAVPQLGSDRWQLDQTLHVRGSALQYFGRSQARMVAQSLFDKAGNRAFGARLRPLARRFGSAAFFGRLPPAAFARAGRWPPRRSSNSLFASAWPRE